MNMSSLSSLEKRLSALERLIAPKMLVNAASLNDQHPMRRAAYIVGS
jgi:hypothetical protein